MSGFDALFESIGPIAKRMQDLQQQAAQQYKPWWPPKLPHPWPPQIPPP